MCLRQSSLFIESILYCKANFTGLEPTSRLWASLCAAKLTLKQTLAIIIIKKLHGMPCLPCFMSGTANSRLRGCNLHSFEAKPYLHRSNFYCKTKFTDVFLIGASETVTTTVRTSPNTRHWRRAYLSAKLNVKINYARAPCWKRWRLAFLGPIITILRFFH